MRDLTAQQTRQLIDVEQLYASYRNVRRELDGRFSGSIAWKTVKGRDYLYRKRLSEWKSLGPRDTRTEEIFDAFKTGREQLRERRRTLDKRLREMAPVNKAMRLGRVPLISARLLRKIERLGLLGHGLKVAGTHALYAYELMGGVHFGEEAITTLDIDLLYDERGSLKLVSAELQESGLMGILRSQDASFRPTEANSFRAANDEGFMVDLITPSVRAPATRDFQARIGSAVDDLAAAEIDGLAWLENVPPVTRIVIDEGGYPLTLVAPDPRAFACHKAWLARRDDREPMKRRRDLLQARSVAKMLVTRLPAMRFDDAALKAVPAELLRLGQELAEAGARQSAAERLVGDWDS
jgi:hypothetical protein